MLDSAVAAAVARIVLPGRGRVDGGVAARVQLLPGRAVRIELGSPRRTARRSGLRAWASRGSLTSTNSPTAQQQGGAGHGEQRGGGGLDRLAAHRPRVSRRAVRSRRTPSRRRRTGRPAAPDRRSQPTPTPATTSSSPTARRSDPWVATTAATPASASSARTRNRADLRAGQLDRRSTRRATAYQTRPSRPEQHRGRRPAHATRPADGGRRTRRRRHGRVTLPARRGAAGADRLGAVTSAGGPAA